MLIIIECFRSKYSKNFNSSKVEKDTLNIPKYLLDEMCRANRNNLKRTQINKGMMFKHPNPFHKHISGQDLKGWRLFRV